MAQVTQWPPAIDEGKVEISPCQNGYYILIWKPSKVKFSIHSWCAANTLRKCSK